ncbi:hypothetical protein D1872_98220 [compost metagenome]
MGNVKNVTNNGMILVLFILLVIIVSGFTKQNTKAGPGNSYMTAPSKLVPVGILPQSTGSQSLLAGCKYGDVNYSVGTHLCLSGTCHTCNGDGTWSNTNLSCGPINPCL